MQNSYKGLIVALALIAGGDVAFFLFLYNTGHDPDGRPLSLLEWVLGGALIGPGFGYLVQIHMEIGGFRGLSVLRISRPYDD